jgi:hypothetical protein
VIIINTEDTPHKRIRQIEQELEQIKEEAEDLYRRMGCYSANMAGHFRSFLEENCLDNKVRVDISPMEFSQYAPEINCRVISGYSAKDSAHEHEVESMDVFDEGQRAWVRDFLSQYSRGLAELLRMEQPIRERHEAAYSMLEKEYIAGDGLFPMPAALASLADRLEDIGKQDRPKVSEQDIDEYFRATEKTRKSPTGFRGGIKEFNWDLTYPELLAYRFMVKTTGSRHGKGGRN